MGICAIFLIPCACVACTSMLDKPWMSGKPSDEQERYKPDTTTSHSNHFIAFPKTKKY